MFGFQNISKNTLISNNATIIVPTIGKTAASIGGVLKGIYEIKENFDKANDLINYSGGFSTPGNFNLNGKVFMIMKNQEKFIRTKIFIMVI